MRYILWVDKIRRPIKCFIGTFLDEDSSNISLKQDLCFLQNAQQLHLGHKTLPLATVYLHYQNDSEAFGVGYSGRSSLQYSQTTKVSVVHSTQVT